MGATGYHGTWTKDLRRILPGGEVKEVRDEKLQSWTDSTQSFKPLTRNFKPWSLDFLGVWITSSKDHATLYGPEVYEVEIPEGKYLKGALPFQDTFFDYELGVEFLSPLVRKWLSGKLKGTDTGLAGAYERYLKGWSTKPRPSFGSFPRTDQALIDRAEKEIEEIYLHSKKYLLAWKALQQSRGFDGVVWRNSKLDVWEEHAPHDAYLIWGKLPPVLSKSTLKEEEIEEAQSRVRKVQAGLDAYGEEELAVKLATWRRHWKPGKRQHRLRGRARVKSKQHYRRNRSKILRAQRRRRRLPSYKNNPARKRSEALRRKQNRHRVGSDYLQPSPSRVFSRFQELTSKRASVKVPDPYKMTREEFIQGVPEPKADPGYQLLYHVTHNEALEGIAKYGLQTRFSKSPPKGSIWASSSADAFYGGGSGSLVVFQVPQRGSPSDKDVASNKVNWDVGDSVVLFRDVLPRDILLIDPNVKGQERLSHFQASPYAGKYWDMYFSPEVREARYSPPKERGGENGSPQRRQPGPEKREDALYYRQHRTKIKLDAKKQYRQKCKVNINCKRRKENYQEHPERYKRRAPRMGSVLTVPEIAFTLGEEMVLGYVRSLSPMSRMVTVSLETNLNSPLLSLPISVFLRTAVLMTDEDEESFFALVDAEIGLEAYDDLHAEDLQECLGLYGIDPDSEEFKLKCLDFVEEIELLLMSPEQLDTVSEAISNTEPVVSTHHPSLFYGEVRSKLAHVEPVIVHTHHSNRDMEVSLIDEGTGKILSSLHMSLLTSDGPKRYGIGHVESEILGQAYGLEVYLAAIKYATDHTEGGLQTLDYEASEDALASRPRLRARGVNFTKIMVGGGGYTAYLMTSNRGSSYPTKKYILDLYPDT